MMTRTKARNGLNGWSSRRYSRKASRGSHQVLTMRTYLCRKNARVIKEPKRIAAPKSNTKIPSIFLFAFFLQCVCARQYWHAITFRTDSTARGPYAMNPPVVCCHRACNLQLPTAVPSCRFGTALSTVGSCTAPRASRHGGLSAITKTQSVRLLPLRLANPFGMRQSMLARGESKRL